MTSPLLLKDLFLRSPTRELEEVQKVNATAQAQRDVEEFYETDSATQVLQRLGTLVEEARPHALRFLYLHATFGSGKTHLLKLIGFATGEAGVDPSVVTELSDRSEGFLALRQSIRQARADVLVPVFLNLLNRDAAADPPIPMLMFRALARALGYPTDLVWLPEWALEFDAEHKLWQALTEQTARGQTFQKALADRGTFRAWLYEAAPALAAERGVSLDAADVRASVERAEEATKGRAFDADALARRVQRARDLLSERRGASVDFLFGLDEIALFIGDNQERFDELRRTVEALTDGPNPIVLGTGQWSLAEVRRSFYGDVDPGDWYANEVRLEGADTEVITRKRWLLKKETARSQIEAYLHGLSLSALGGVGEPTLESAVEAYPFRATDLRLLRSAMQGLLTGSRPTKREHIQGRALLVLVRALFAQRGWAGKPLGALVSWDELFDLLVAATTYVSTWVQDLIARLESTLGADAPEAVRAAKAMYLVGRAEGTPATASTLAHLLTGSTDDDIGDVRQNVQEALDVLTERRYAHAEKAGGRVTYRLLTQEEVSLAEKIEARAEQIPLAQMRGHILERLRTGASLLIAEGTRQEVNIGEAQDVPVQAYYSVLQDAPAPRPHPEAVTFRVLVGSDLDGKVQAWKEANAQERHLEDLLVAVRLPGAYLSRLRRLMATGHVLQNEPRRFPELEAGQQEDERELRGELREALQQAAVHKPSGGAVGSFVTDFASYVAQEIVPTKFPQRRTLQRPLQPLDDARRLAQFFGGSGDWPLAPEDLATLGVRRLSRSVEGGWAKAFFDTFGEGALVSGAELLDATEAHGGAFLGTPREALAALLLTLAAARRIQLRTDGRLLLDPRGAGQAVRTRADLAKLSLRLEPPVDRSEIERLRRVSRTLMAGAAPATDDPETLAEALTTWSADHYGSAQQVQQRLARTFPQVNVGALNDMLRRAARGDALDATAWAGEDVSRQAKQFARARTLFDGAHADTWAAFETERQRLQDEGLTRPTIEAVFERRAVPTPQEVQALIERAKLYPLGEAHSGAWREDRPADGEDTTPLPGFKDLPGGDEATTEAVDAIMERLRNLPDGSIILIEKSES